MKFVFASDSFKGSLSSARIGQLLEDAARAVRPDAECVLLSIADGGEGTLDAIAAVHGGNRVATEAHDGLMRPVTSEVLICENEAFVECASACGLALLAPEELDPMAATSYGVGECIREALDRGCERITVGLGGSCTNDGGAGCMRALGARLFDADGNELEGRGADLARIARIDTRGLHPAAKAARFVVMSDVTNPLLGAQGATYVFGRQKGADAETLEQLESGMRAYAQAVAARCCDVDFDTPGYGAAGGLGMALAVFLGAQIRPGIEELLSWFDFDNILVGADLVVTGEGRLDEQSLHGKVVDGIAAHAKKAGVPVAVICGTSTLDQEMLRSRGIVRVVEAGAGQELAHAMRHAETNYIAAARDLMESLAPR